MSKKISTPLYRAMIVWRNMHSRCYNSTDKSFHRYGGRKPEPITVCPRWHHFPNFHADMGDPPPGKILDREDNEEGYGPGNCWWVTPKKSSNNMRSNRIIVYQGQKKTMSEWADHFGVDYHRFAKRIEAGWPFEEAAGLPVDRKNRTKAKRYDVNGVPQTLRELAKQTGKSPEAIRIRLREGWDLKEAVFAPIDPKKRRTAQLVTAFGQTRTVPQLAKMYGHKPTTVYGRLDRGWSIERALTTPSQKTK